MASINLSSLPLPPPHPSLQYQNVASPVVLHQQNPQSAYQQQAATQYRQALGPVQNPPASIIPAGHQVIHTQVYTTTSKAPEVQTMTSMPIRQYVCFKNRRDLNSEKRQWEHADHITMEISPDELEREIRRHDIPGNELTSCVANMGMFRQRHLKRYEEKLNRKEVDSSNYNWVLEALGEEREKSKSTPHSFWAIFQRTYRHGTQQSRQIQLPPPPQPTQTIVVTTAEPSQGAMQGSAGPSFQAQQFHQQPQQLALPPPPGTQQLALPAPSHGQNHGQGFQATSTTYQNSPYQSASTAMVPRSMQSPASANSSFESLQQTTQGRVYMSQPQQGHSPYGQTGFRNSQSQPQLPRPPVVHQQHPALVQQSAPRVSNTLPATAARPARPTMPARSVTQPGNVKTYSRPLPGPVATTTQPGRSASTSRGPRVDVHQFREHSPPRFTANGRGRRENWEDDSLSDSSESSWRSGSSGRTSMTSDSMYEVAGTKPRRVQIDPFGKEYHSHSSSGRSRSRRTRHETKSSTKHHSHGHHRHRSSAETPRQEVHLIEQPRMSSQQVPLVRPPVRREDSTTQVDIKFTSPRNPRAPRPAPVRRAYTSPHVPQVPPAPMPGRFNSDEDEEFDFSDDDAFEARFGRMNIGSRRGRRSTESPNRYQTAGLASYGASGRREYNQ